jgi:hypothetical protein
MVGSEQQISDYSNLRYPQVVTTEGVTKDLRITELPYGGSELKSGFGKLSAALSASRVTEYN